MGVFAKILLCGLIVCLGRLDVGLEATEIDGVSMNSYVRLERPSGVIGVLDAFEPRSSGLDLASMPLALVLADDPEVGTPVIESIEIQMVDVTLVAMPQTHDHPMHGKNAISSLVTVPPDPRLSVSDVFRFGCRPFEPGNELMVLVVDYGEQTLGDRYSLHGRSVSDG